MESELHTEEQKVVESGNSGNDLHKVTPLSKYLALALFIILPFVGGYVAYQYVPPQIIETERVIVVDQSDGSTGVNPELAASSQNEYRLLDVINWDGEELRYLRKDDDLYVFVAPVMSSIETHVKISGVDFDSLEHVGSGYFKDKNRVYYAFDGTVRVMDGAHAETFQALYPNGTDYPSWGITQDAVYFRTKELIGLDPTELKLTESGSKLPIMSDSDTIWFPAGDAHYGGYREGTFEEQGSWDRYESKATVY